MTRSILARLILQPLAAGESLFVGRPHGPGRHRAPGEADTQGPPTWRPKHRGVLPGDLPRPPIGPTAPAVTRHTGRQGGPG